MIPTAAPGRRRPPANITPPGAEKEAERAEARRGAILLNVACFLIKQSVKTNAAHKQGARHQLCPAQKEEGKDSGGRGMTHNPAVLHFPLDIKKGKAT